MTAATNLRTFDQMTRDDDWKGWGYLGERERNADHANRADADAFVIAYATSHNWTDADLFTWANSRNGRKFGDLAFGGWDNWAEMAEPWGLLKPVYN